MNSLLLVEIFCVTGILTVFYWLFKYLALRSRLNKSIPGRPSYPFLGDLLILNGVPDDEIYNVLVGLSDEYGMKKGGNGMSMLWLGPIPLVNLRKPEHLKTILCSSKLVQKSIIYNHIKDYIGVGLFNSSADVWPRQRRMLTPAFHSQLLGEFVDPMIQKAEILNEKIAQSLKMNPDKAIAIHHLVLGCTLETLCETVMGVTNMAKDCVYSGISEKAIATMIKRTVVPWYSLDFIFYRTKLGQQYKELLKIVHDFTLSVILQKQAERANSKTMQHSTGKKRKTFLDLLLDASESQDSPLSLKEIRAHVDTFMFAGHDLTAASIIWTLFVLGNNLEVQEKVHQEIEEVFGNDYGDPITQKQLDRMEYLDRVIKEGLRMYPPGPFIGRRLTEDTIIDGILIPKYTEILMHIHSMQNDPEIWENPTKFNPDRFLPENCRNRHPYAYIPFSAGPRNCIGQKFGFLHLKIILATVLRKWSVRSVLKPDEIRFKWYITLTSQQDIELFFTPKSCNELLVNK